MPEAPLLRRSTGRLQPLRCSNLRRQPMPKLEQSFSGLTSQTAIHAPFVITLPNSSCNRFRLPSQVLLPSHSYKATQRLFCSTSDVDRITHVLKAIGCMNTSQAFSCCSRNIDRRRIETSGRDSRQHMCSCFMDIAC